MDKSLLWFAFFCMTVVFPATAYSFEGDTSVFMYESKHVGQNDKYHKEGRRKNVLVVPHSSRPDDLTLVVWFHGLGGFTEKTFSRVMTQLKTASATGHSIAVLIPEMPWSAATSTPRSRQGKIWKKSNQFKFFLDEAVSLLKTDFRRRKNIDLPTPNIIVIGHSAGGSAIMSAALEGSLCDKRVSHVVWSDASYGTWLSRANKGCLKHKRILQTIVVRKWDKPHVSAKKFFKDNPDASDDKLIVLDRRKYSHTRIGNEIVRIASLFPPGC